MSTVTAENATLKTACRYGKKCDKKETICKKAHFAPCYNGVACKLDDAEHRSTFLHHCLDGDACINDNAVHRGAMHPGQTVAPSTSIDSECQFGMKCRYRDTTCKKTHSAPVDQTTQDCQFGLKCRYRDTTCKKKHPGEPATAAPMSSPAPLTRTKKFVGAKPHKEYQTPEGARKFLVSTRRFNITENLSHGKFRDLGAATAQLIGEKPCEEADRDIFLDQIRALGIRPMSDLCKNSDGLAFKNLIKILAVATGNATPKTSEKKPKGAPRPKPHNDVKAEKPPPIAQNAGDDEAPPVINFGIDLTQSGSWADSE